MSRADGTKHHGGHPLPMGLFDRLFGKREPDTVVGAGVAEDPVCHMQVDTRTALRSAHGGQTFHFCSAGCKQQFDADPHRFMGAHAH